MAFDRLDEEEPVKGGKGKVTAVEIEIVKFTERHNLLVLAQIKRAVAKEEALAAGTAPAQDQWLSDIEVESTPGANKRVAPETPGNEPPTGEETEGEGDE